MTGTVQGLHMGLGAGAPVTGAYTGGTAVFNSDGTCAGTAYSGPAGWSSQYPSTGVGGRYWVRFTRTGGSGSSSISPASGTWTSVASAVTLTATGGAGSSTGTVDFAIDSGGATIVASGTFSVNNTL